MEQIDMAWSPTVNLFNAYQNRIQIHRSNITVEHYRKLDEQPNCWVFQEWDLVTEEVLRLLQIKPRNQMGLLLDSALRTDLLAPLNSSPYLGKNTRIFYYSWIDRVGEGVKLNSSPRRTLEPSRFQADTSQSVSAVFYGVELLAIFSLPFEKTVLDKIDRLLLKICEELHKERSDLMKIFNYENNLLHYASDLRIYCDAPELHDIRYLSRLTQLVRDIKTHKKCTGPLRYIVEPIGSITAFFTGLWMKWNRRMMDDFKKTWNTALKFTIMVNNLRTYCHEYHLRMFSDNFRNIMTQKLSQCLDFLRNYYTIFQRLGVLSPMIDERVAGSYEMYRLLKDEEWHPFSKDMTDLLQEAKELCRKARLIGQLQLFQIDYFASEYLFNQDHSLQYIRKRLIKEHPNHTFLCSSDSLNQTSCNRWIEYCADLIRMRQVNSCIQLGYVDFSYSTIKLQDIILVTPEDPIDEDESPLLTQGTRTSQEHLNETFESTTDRDSISSEHLLITPPSSVSSFSELDSAFGSARASISSSITSEYPEAESVSPDVQGPQSEQVSDINQAPSADMLDINILLVGQSGVGKSTFINAIANYLKFSSLQQALDGEPIVLIPVSFIITTGFNFDEQVITFDQCDHAENEHFNNIGQSVTQQCREYTFDIGGNGGQRIRLIDTPGFGDTRGIDKDQENIDQIKEYIKQYQSLDAICFLLKPNESRLNIALRSSLMQFVAVVREAAHEKLIFCFTNARSTFYAPGNTGSLMRKFLADWHLDQIKLQKQNTFCFDNESFRYLVAARNGIEFSTEEHTEYQRSWEVSVKESNRLLDYIVGNATRSRSIDQ